MFRGTRVLVASGRLDTASRARGSPLDTTTAQTPIVMPLCSPSLSILTLWLSRDSLVRTPEQQLRRSSKRVI